MAIAVDTTSTGFVNSGTSKTVAHTCNGADRALFVGVHGDVTSDLCTGVTYAGAAMTLVNKAKVNTGRWIYLFYKANPSSGANNIIASFSGTSYIELMGVSYTGVSSGALDATTTNSGTATTSVTTTLTTVADNCWTVLLGASSNSPIGAGAGTTLRKAAGNFPAIALFDSNAALTPAGSKSLIVTRAANDSFQTVMASIAPAGAVATASRNSLTLLGVS